MARLTLVAAASRARPRDTSVLRVPLPAACLGPCHAAGGAAEGVEVGATMKRARVACTV